MSTRYLAWFDEDEDRLTRYGNYLRLHPEMFERVESTSEFAQACWLVATGPIMSPGFVEVRDDVSIRIRHDEAGEGILLASVGVPVSAHQLRATYRFPDADTWRLDHSWSGEFPRYLPPTAREGQVAVLPTFDVRVTIEAAALPVVPSVMDGSEPHLAAAVAALGVLCRQIEAGAAFLVEQMRG